MSKHRLNLEFDAFQWRGPGDDAADLDGCVTRDSDGHFIDLDPGDWILEATDRDGNVVRLVVTDANFRRLYVPVAEGDEAHPFPCHGDRVLGETYTVLDLR